MRKILVTLALCSACGASAPKENVMPTDAPVANATAAEEVRGTAQNAKAGAVLVAEDGRIVYVDGLDAWPDNVVGQAVVATGKLSPRPGSPPPGPEDEVAADVGEGEAWLLTEADWKVE